MNDKDGSKLEASKLFDEFNRERGKLADLIQTQKSTIQQTVEQLPEKVHSIFVQWEQGFDLHMKDLLDNFQGDTNLKGFQIEPFYGRINQALETSCQRIDRTLQDLIFQLEKNEMKQLSTLTLLVSNQQSLEQELQTLRDELVAVKHQHKSTADEFLTEMRALFQQHKKT